MRFGREQGSEEEYKNRKWKDTGWKKVFWTVINKGKENQAERLRKLTSTLRYIG